MLAGFLNKYFFVNPSRKRLEAFAVKAAGSVEPGSIVLDAGAGDCVYKPLFSQLNYESADFQQVDKRYAEVTYVCDLKSIPVEENRYDLVFCSQVLEHLPDPMAVLKELNRVLKPNGKLWLSMPFFYEEHEVPFDFFRYTRNGLEELLSKSGFEVEEIDWLEGYYGTLAYQFKTIATKLPVSPKHYGGIIFKIIGPLVAVFLKAIAIVLSLFYSRADTNKRYIGSGYGKNYYAIALKTVD